MIPCAVLSTYVDPKEQADANHSLDTQDAKLTALADQQALHA